MVWSVTIRVLMLERRLVRTLRHKWSYLRVGADHKAAIWAQLCFIIPPSASD